MGPRGVDAEAVEPDGKTDRRNRPACAEQREQPVVAAAADHRAAVGARRIVELEDEAGVIVELASRKAVAALQFLSRHDALDRVAPADLPAATGAADEPPLFTRIAAAYGLDLDRGDGSMIRTKYVQFMPAGIPLAGFDRYLPPLNLTPRPPGDDARNPDQAHSELAVRLEDRLLEVSRGAILARFPLDALIEAASGGDGSGPQPAAGIRLDDGPRHILLLPTVLELILAEPPTVRFLITAIAYRAADWPAPPADPARPPANP